MITISILLLVLFCIGVILYSEFETHIGRRVRELEKTIEELRKQEEEK